MGNVNRSLSLVLLLFMTALAPFSIGALAEAAESGEGILVGRIAHVEGKLLRYIEEEKDWVVTVKDSPFGLEDALYSEEDTRAEFIMPNRTWLRMGENTQIQLIDLNPDATTLDVGSGLVRLYNRSENTVVKAITPFGYVVASGDTVFDLYVGDESLEVIALRGKVDFVHERFDTRYEVRSGSFSVIADHSETARGNGTVDSVWDDWNGKRDVVWNKRLRGKSYSAGFVPEPLRDEAYALDEAGRWERVYYEGGYRDMWRPIRVERGWRPFTAGRWVVYYGDNCWIPDEPFGYITHHYGSWIYVETRRCWYWVPPVARIAAAAQQFSLRFGWYPGRVGWIHRDTFVGWVPLAAHEMYYSHRPWGYRTVVVNPNASVNVSVNVNLASFFFVNHAVVIHRDHFFSGRKYTPYIERNIGRDVIINNYQPITVINNTVINNYSAGFRRFSASELEVSRKPHRSVVDRIVVNHKMRSEFGSIGRERIMKDMTRVRSMAEPSGKREIHSLKVASKLVERDKVDKPLEALSLKRKEIKGQARKEIKGQARERRVADSKIARSSEKSERGNREQRSPRGEKKSAVDELSRQDGKHGEKARKSQGWQDGESKQSRKQETRDKAVGAGKKSESEQKVKSQKKDRQEGLPPEKKAVSSGGKGLKNQEKGPGKQGRQEEGSMFQEQYAKKGGGKKND